jgi:DNA-binding SARP family transcriptional activator/tetratricopeptide (TPR) repeat protein
VGDEGGVPLQFRILGPLDVVRGEECLAFRGTRERAVLALLVLHANRTVSAERLADDLWSGDPPEGAIHSLRVYVSRLRQALGAAGQTVVTRPSGYVLEVDPEAVDAWRFEALVARGRDEARAGDHERAATTFREAMTLWRGRALADVAEAPLARAEASRLEEARLAALEDCIEADLACGRHGEVTAELEAVTREHPFRERLWSQRMIALYRSGRQADALRAYHQLRSALGEQLGIEPSSALQGLEGAVLRHDPALDWHRGETGGPVATPSDPLGASARKTGLVEGGVTAGAQPGRLPQPLGREERFPLVGREVELSELDQVWQATCSGQRQLVLVTGEPGIGKSRLSAEFARTAHGGGAAVLFGRCDEGMGVPYQPFVEALSRYLRQAPDVVLGRLAGELVRLVPEVGERVPGLSPPLRSDPETERYRLFDAVTAWLGAVSETAPVLVVIEDVHWATKPTLLLLAHLLRADEDLRLLVLVTFRDTPLDMTPELADLVAELLRQPGVERLRLTGLDEPSVGALMEAQAGHDLDDDGWALARIVHGETGGNPFYVREILSLLAEKGDIVRRDGRWVPGQPLAKLDVPDSVRDVVERRLTRLPDRTSEMLAVAAVLGERFDLAVLAEASGDSESSVIETLRPAVGARLVTETDAGRYQFTHALVRSALEDALGPTRAVQLHRAAGSAVEAVHAAHLDVHLPQLAHHFARARDVERAIEYASRAGDRALDQLAHDEAAAYYRQALELLDRAGRPDGEARRCELLIALGEAQRRSGDPAYRQTLLDAAGLADHLGDSDALARAVLANSRGFFSISGGVDAPRVAALERALDRAATADTTVRARLLANLADELVWSDQHERRQGLAAEALALARRSGDPVTLAYVLARRYPTLVPNADRRAEMVELEQLAAGLDASLLVWAHLWRSLTDLTHGHLEGYHRGLDSAKKLADELRQPLLRWPVAFLDAGRYRMAGRLDEAEARNQEAFTIGQAAGVDDAFMIYSSTLWWIRYDQGRLDEVLDRYERRSKRADPLPFALAHLGIAYCEVGRPGDAEHVLDRLAADEFAALPINYARAYGLTMTAEVCAGVRDAERAAVLYGQLHPYTGLVATAGSLTPGSVDHYLGLLAVVEGRFDQAGRHFEAAHASHEALAAPAWLARTRLEWARMLLTRRQPGDTSRAQELLGQALETARELGLANIERKAVNLLAPQ